MINRESRMDLRKVKKIRQRDKDIVYGYIKIAQLLFRDAPDNPYYIINQLIQDLCLLYFHLFIESKILSDNEIDSFMKLLRDNDKPEFDHYEYKLIYRSSRDGLGKLICENKVYGKKNILMIVESEGNNVCGGYTLTGWETGKKLNYSTTKDSKAFLYNIRSSKGYKPCISNVKDDCIDSALAYYDLCYCSFGDGYVLNIWNNGRIYNNVPASYHAFPENSKQLLGGNHGETIKELEIYQLT